VISKKILLVEDDHASIILFRFYLKKILNLNDDDITDVNNGEDAINIIKNNRNFSFIIMDIELSGNINGITTSKELLKIHYIPIITITAQGLYKQSKHPDSITDFLTSKKPSSQEDLKTCLTKHDLII